MMTILKSLIWQVNIRTLYKASEFFRTPKVDFLA